MDESEQESTKSELSDSWMVIRATPPGQAKENGTPSDGSDGESVEVLDQEEYDEGTTLAGLIYCDVLTGGTDYDAAQTDEELSGPKNKKYVHHPNKDVNAALNRLMVIAASVVVGLAVGHYLGYSEEVNDMATTVKKLHAENFKLKNLICTTLENYDNHVVHIADNAYPELKHFNENYAVFLTVLLNLTCPHTESKLTGLQTYVDDLRHALLSGHISDDELHDRIGKILKNRSNGHEVTDYTNFSDGPLQNERETFTTQGSGMSGRVSQTLEPVTFKEHSSVIHAHVESPTLNTQEEVTLNKELHTAPVSVQAQVEGTVGALSGGPIESPLEICEGCQAATDSIHTPVNSEVPNKNMLKHIVKDVVQEITESLIALHHDDIIRDIRNEAKKLMRSFPVFKSALLLNKEVTSKLKSHLKYIKDMLYSVLENSPHMTDKGKIDKIFSSMNLHAMHLEKAMESMQFIERTLNPKITSVFNVQRSNVCTVSDFLKEVFIKNHRNTHTMEHNSKHSNDPQTENNIYTANQSPPCQNIINDATEENLSPKSTIESDGKTSNVENFQNIQNYNKFVTQQPLHGRPSKHYKRQIHKVYDQNKKKQDYDNKKHKISRQHNVETKQYNEKDEGKYKDFKTTKENHHDQQKKIKKQFHYKEEKYFKREICDTRKKTSHNIYKWDKDGDHRHSNMSGDWVIDMNKARAESRENEHKSDWLFERANARKAKRNGKWDMNNWYFQRAEGRRSCRQKSGNDKSKIPYAPPNDSEKEYHDSNSKQHQKQRRYFKPKRWISKAYMTVSKFKF